MTLAPRCIWCAKAIAKHTETHWFGSGPVQHRQDPSHNHVEVITTKAEAQRLVNGAVVSVSRWREHVAAVGVWDGETYADRYFCGGRCRNAYAYHVAGLGVRP